MTNTDKYQLGRKDYAYLALITQPQYTHYIQWDSEPILEVLQSIGLLGLLAALQEKRGQWFGEERGRDMVSNSEGLFTKSFYLFQGWSEKTQPKKTHPKKPKKTHMKKPTGFFQKVGFFSFLFLS